VLAQEQERALVRELEQGLELAGEQVQDTVLEQVAELAQVQGLEQDAVRVLARGLEQVLA